MIKICIVGPEESKWKPEQIPKAKQTITDILMKHYTEYDNYGQFEPELEVVLVSGHCPKKGVDIWAEEIADVLRITKQIYAPEVYQWADSSTAKVYHREGVTKRLKGYRTRNIDMAKACDIVYCIVPKRYTSPDYEDVIFNKDLKCIHCKMAGHPTNGGCWTMKYAKKLGKEVHLVVIE